MAIVVKYYHIEILTPNDFTLTKAEAMTGEIFMACNIDEDFKGTKGVLHPKLMRKFQW